MHPDGISSRFDEREYELLAPAIAAIARSAEADQLCTALALTEGFQFDVVVCSTPRDADAVLAWLAVELPDRRGEEVRFQRLRLDRGTDDARLAPTVLTESILSRLLDASGRPAKAVVVVDATAYRSDEHDAWRWLFQRWNERRNRIIAAVAAPLVLLLPTELDAALAAEAPDLWSIRSVSVRLPASEVAIGRSVPYSSRRFEPGALERARSAVAALRRSKLTPLLALAQALRRLVEQELASGHVFEAAGAVHDLMQVRPVIHDSLELAKIDRTEAAVLMASGRNADAIQVLRDRVLSAMEQEASAYQRALTYRAMAHALVGIGDLAAALRCLEERVLPLDHQIHDEHGSAETLGEIADIRALRGEVGEALRLRRQILPVYEQLGDARSRAITAGKIADILFAQGQLDEALRIWREDSLPVFEQLDDSLSRAVTRAKMADVLLARGQFDEAVEIWDDVLPVFRRLGDVRSRAITAGKIADLRFARGDLDAALRLRRDEELPAYQQLGDVRAVAATQDGIADVLFARGELLEALRIRRREQLPIYQRLGDRRGVAMTRGAIADILLARGKFGWALRIRQEQELPAYEQLGDTRAAAATQAKIADMLFSRGQVDEARQLRDGSLLAYQQLLDARARAVTQAKIAEIYEARGNLDEALRTLQREVAPVLDRLGDMRSKAFAEIRIAEIHEARGNPDEALRTLQREVEPVLDLLGDTSLKADTEARITKLLAAHSQRGGARRPSGARHHVLLVGIDDYASKPLSGCVNDIDAIQRVWLGPRVGIAPGRIRRLASPRGGAAHDTAVSAQPATLANLRAALGELGSSAVSAGDRVFIYFAGHGSRVEVSADGRTYFREALVPVDAFLDPSDPRLLFDFEVNAHLARILARTVHVTCILDCCFTEAATRDVAPRWITRFLPVPHEPAWRKLLPDPAGSHRDGMTVQPLARSVDGGQVVVACLEHEMAREAPGHDGLPHGLFTSALVKALEAVMDVDLREVAWNRIWQALCADLWQRSPDQHPWMSGNMGGAVLAGAALDGDRAFPVTRRGEAYRIGAGTLAAVIPGAVVAIYGDRPAYLPQLDSEADREARLGVVRVTFATHGSAIAGAVGKPFELPPGARGRLIRTGRPQRLRCGLVPHDEALARQIVGSPLLELVEPSLASVLLELREGRWILTDDLHGTQQGPMLFALQPGEIGRARQLLEHYYAYAEPLRMATLTADLPGGLELTVLAPPAHELSPAKSQAADLPQAPTGLSGVYQLRAGMPVCFRVRNRTASYLRVTLVNSAASGKVQLLGDQVIDHGASYVFWAGGSLGVPFQMQVPAGMARCIDRMTAIGTTSMTRDLSYLRVGRTFADTVRGTRSTMGKDKPLFGPDLPPPLERWTAAQAIVETRAG